MDEVLNIYKPLGMTTFQAIERFKQITPEYKDVPIAYTGRLDPMAEGVLIFLAGEKRYEAKSFQKMKKAYTAKILVGFSTDSYDLLGLVKKESFQNVLKKDVNKFLKRHQGKTSFYLPPYCAYRINGKPMFHLMREDKLDQKDIPKKEMTLYKSNIKKIFKIEKKTLRNYIFKTINKVRGDFRQKEIIKNWHNILIDSDLNEFQIIEIFFEVSGGTYIRSIVNAMSEELNSGFLLYHLIRNKVNEYNEFDSIKL